MGDTSTMERTVSPQTSMTLSVTPDDAQRMQEASQALNERLARLRQEKEDAPSYDPSVESLANEDQEDDGPPVPKRVVSTSDHGSIASDDGTEATLRPVVLEAAATCGNPLVESFIQGLQAIGAPDYEVQTCLLLFLQTSKSNKLRSAFRLLSSARMAKTDEGAADKEALKYDGAVTLFRCFLTSISSCIQYKPAATEDHPMEESAADPAKQDSNEPPAKALKESEQSSPNSVAQSEEPAQEGSDESLPRASPSFDSSMESRDASAVLPEDVRKEIDEIALFATDKLLEHIRKQSQDKDVSTVPYESFGDWYNSGGFAIVPWLELLDLAKWDSADKPAPVDAGVAGLETIQEESPEANDSTEKSPPEVATQSPEKAEGDSPINFFKVDEKEKKPAPSRILVSFDFTGALASADGKPRAAPQPSCCIDISEENLRMLRNLVHRTGLSSRSPSEVRKILFRHATQEGGVLVLSRDAFGKCIRDLVPEEAARSFSRVEMEHFSIYFTNFYSCFDSGNGGVNVKEVAVAFAFLCAGNKSAKLSIGFELLDEEKSGHLTQHQLQQYVRSYLTMLVGISLLSENPDDKKKSTVSDERRQEMIAAIDSGAKWTLRHLSKHFADIKGVNEDAISFENFASWYTSGGYNIAPWLELLDLSKLLALLDESGGPKQEAISSRDDPSPRRRFEGHHSSPTIPPTDVLFTFPLANRRSLVVLREDARYVRTVVDNLGLLTMSTEDLWSALLNKVKSEPSLPPPAWNRPRPRKVGTGKARDVDQAMFVKGMEGVIESASGGRKRPSKGATKTSSAARETLKNFFQSFDLDQIDRVALNQLMGGLSLLCGGKKSTKLAFAFGLFDNSKPKPKKKSVSQPSLSGEELFFFLRSFLIVTFSCCRQSMDLSAEAVGRSISDTAHMVAEDVMRYQWHKRKKDRVNFDQFGEWYNEGGFETAPWLELLDLKKWVLVDNLDSIHQQRASAPFHRSLHLSRSEDYDCPPPPPDDQVDPSFFADDDHPLMQMDSIDEMDLMLMRSHEKENDGIHGNNMFNTLLASPRGMPIRKPQSNSLKFHLVTNEEHGGYMLSVSERRVASLRHVLLESGLCQVDAEDASRKILSRSKVGSKGKTEMILSKEEFDRAMRTIIPGGKSMNMEAQRILSDLLTALFHAFDRTSSGLPSAREVASGFTILCRGKKSDKLEHAFEVMEGGQSGQMTRREVSLYLGSFLSALLSIIMAPCLDMDDNEETLSLLNTGAKCESNMLYRVAEAGSEWAAGQAFQSRYKKEGENDTLSFDDFAEWYTSEGFSSIPWLELLDLRKWVLT